MFCRVARLGLLLLFIDQFLEELVLQGQGVKESLRPVDREVYCSRLTQTLLPADTNIILTNSLSSKQREYIRKEVAQNIY